MTGTPWMYPRRVLALAMTLILVGAGCGGDEGTDDAASLAQEVQERGVVRAGIRQDNPPHSFIDGSGDWVGFDVDIARAVADELGVNLEMVRVDQDTRIAFLTSGRIDMAVASMSHTYERDAEIDFSQTYFWSAQTFLVRADGAQSLADLAGRPVGVDRGSHAAANWRTWLADHGFDAEPEIVEFTDKQAAVDAVRQGAIAGWAQDYEILVSFAAHDPSLAVLANESIGTKQDGIGVPENDSDWLDAINQALQRITASGQYQRIYDEWFGPNSTTPVPIQDAIEVWPEG